MCKDAPSRLYLLSRLRRWWECSLKANHSYFKPAAEQCEVQCRTTFCPVFFQIALFGCDKQLSSFFMLSAMKREMYLLVSIYVSDWTEAVIPCWIEMLQKTSYLLLACRWAGEKNKTTGPCLRLDSLWMILFLVWGFLSRWQHGKWVYCTSSTLSSYLFSCLLQLNGNAMDFHKHETFQCDWYYIIR